jgi:hypothetical protein
MYSCMYVTQQISNILNFKRQISACWVPVCRLHEKPIVIYMHKYVQRHVSHIHLSSKSVRQLQGRARVVGERRCSAYIDVYQNCALVFASFNCRSAHHDSECQHTTCLLIYAKTYAECLLDSTYTSTESTLIGCARTHNSC